MFGIMTMIILTVFMLLFMTKYLIPQKIEIEMGCQFKSKPNFFLYSKFQSFSITNIDKLDLNGRVLIRSGKVLVLFFWELKLFKVYF